MYFSEIILLRVREKYLVGVLAFTDIHTFSDTKREYVDKRLFLFPELNPFGWAGSDILSLLDYYVKNPDVLVKDLDYPLEKLSVIPHERRFPARDFTLSSALKFLNKRNLKRYFLGADESFTYGENSVTWKDVPNQKEGSFEYLVSSKHAFSMRELRALRKPYYRLYTTDTQGNQYYYTSGRFKASLDSAKQYHSPFSALPRYIFSQGAKFHKTKESPVIENLWDEE